MSTTTRQPFDDVVVDHLRLYVQDASATAAWLASYGFEVFAKSDNGGTAHSIGLGRGRIRLLITEPLTDDHPGAAYVMRHGDGVADVALGVPDAAAAFAESVRRGAHPVSEPTWRAGVTTATILGFGDVVHTFVERAAGADERLLPGLRPATGTRPVPDSRLTDVDHLAVCLEFGQLEPTVEHYRHTFDFATIFTEHVRVGAQAMRSNVVQSRSGAVTLTLLEPDPAHEPGQIDEFLKNHGGAGVQHVAFHTDDIAGAVSRLRASGVEFLGTPDAYYQLLEQRLAPARHTIVELRELRVLVDEDQYGQLFQIFARSVHPRRTLFTELVERAGARTFGSGNIKALYQAFEAQRQNDQVGR
jgi:4-hydroxymandelate synthase